MNLTSKKLQVTIYSFSYKKGIPIDTTEHGGGFVFDCRALPNPARLSEFAHKTANDIEVIEYLENFKEVKIFFKLTSLLVCNTIENYLKRNFTHLMVCYGCTGGQHRSVYLANKLSSYLLSKYDIVVNLVHRDIGQ